MTVDFWLTKQGAGQPLKKGREISENRRVYSSLDGKNPLGWEWKLPVILLRTCWGGSQARGGHA